MRRRNNDHVPRVHVGFQEQQFPEEDRHSFGAGLELVPNLRLDAEPLQRLVLPAFDEPAELADVGDGRVFWVEDVPEAWDHDRSDLGVARGGVQHGGDGCVVRKLGRIHAAFGCAV